MLERKTSGLVADPKDDIDMRQSNRKRSLQICFLKVSHEKALPRKARP